ncbi:plasmid pRiA4b ORF-3 family protein [Salipaludibacillus sp. CF4.18]|uniref:plasmid pRiA4b ORF-3 family protein n=1 Tax=Salipaludibacillus sp. CF4.18 TaxID=3373081 RepID=UPI003EE7B622
MLIQCTKKLLTELKVKPEPGPATEEKPLFSWHANIIKLGRKKTLVLTNDSNRYAIVIYGLKAKDFKRIGVVIQEAIRETFREEHIKDDVIEAYISQSKEITFSTTKNRTCVARLNKACENTYFYNGELNEEALFQPPASKNISRLIVGIGKNEYTRPNEDLYRDLEEWKGNPIFNEEGVILKITLDLENHNIWRRIVVPKHMTFTELHQTIQSAFNWQGYHLHAFAIFASKPMSISVKQQAKERKPIVNLVSNEEALSYDAGVPMKMETGIKLSEYLPAEITYQYDFGDDWQHHIVVEQMVDDYDVNYPICLAGEGNAPPEDVGGEPGYDEFLACIKSQTHPEHSHMRSWGISQGYKEFNMDMLNRWLKSL